MADYTQSIDFSTKDAMASGQPAKVAKGVDLDTELALISTAIASKLDSTDYASDAEVVTGTATNKIVNPDKLTHWSIQNGGMVADLQALADPGADRILFWDNGTTEVAALTVSTGLTLSGTNLTTDDSAIDITALSGYDANDHIDHTTVTMTAGTGLTGGGTIAATRTLNVIGGDGITANADDIALTDAAATTSNPVDISSGVVSLDVEALTTMEGSALAATDTFLVEDGGVPKGIEVQAMGLRVQAGETTQILAADDMNTIMEFNGTDTLTIDENGIVDLPLGVPVVIVVDHADQEVTVQADTNVTLNSVYHPGGTANALDVIRAGGTAILFQTETDEWYLSGDIKDS